MKIGVCFIENRSLVFENRSLFFDNRSLFFENLSLLFWKSELVFLKIGVCFFENEFVFENRSLFLWKSEFVFLKIGVCCFETWSLFFLKIGVWFFENRSLLFWKSEFVVLKMGVCFSENGSLFFWKSGFDFLQIGTFFYENPSIGPRFCSVLLLLSWNKISGGSRRGARGTCPPPLIFRPNWGLRPTDRPPPPYLKVWKIYLSLKNFVHVLVKYLMINLDKHLTLSLHESSDLAVSHLGWNFLVLKISRDWGKS